MITSLVELLELPSFIGDIIKINYDVTFTSNHVYFKKAWNS